MQFCGHRRIFDATRILSQGVLIVSLLILRWKLSATLRRREVYYGSEDREVKLIFYSSRGSVSITFSFKIVQSSGDLDSWNHDE